MVTDQADDDVSAIVANDAPYHLVALDRPQLEAAQVKMIAWATARRDRVDVDVDVETTSLDLAAKNGWLTSPFERRLNVLAKQRVFYDKIIQALEAGYAIVPNFQMDVFAIRTKASTARGKGTTSRWANFSQSAQILPSGEGSYRSPLPALYQRQENRPDEKGGTKAVTVYFPEEFKDVEFPIALARPELMSRVGQSMALKLFDEIGVARDAFTGSPRSRATRGDPILLGRLLNPRANRPALTFFLGWYFDPSRL